ncbi:MAG: hypothetical protein HY719_06870 [Planctomycetes bacterium]|nr:hypothetical protein [Planctomycetota bacterium]
MIVKPLPIARIGGRVRRCAALAALFLALSSAAGCGMTHKRHWSYVEYDWEASRARGLAQNYDVTLREKADTYERLFRDHLMTEQGLLVYKRPLADVRQPPDPSKPMLTPYLADQAFWSGCQLAAEAFRFEVTGDAQDKAVLHRVLRGVMMLHQITGKEGLITRCLMNNDLFAKAWMTNEKDREHYKPHEGQGEFKGLWWTDNTSRGEYSGMVFGIVNAIKALENEKDEDTVALVKEARRTLIAFGRHLRDHNMRVTDLDGETTRYGEFDAVRYWVIPIGLSALQALATLKAAAWAEGPGGDMERFYERLIDDGYLDVAKHTKFKAIGKTKHSNDNIAFMSFYVTLSLEQKPDYRARYQESMRLAWGADRDELNSLFNFVYAAMEGEERDADSYHKAIDDGVLTLKWFRKQKTDKEVLNLGREDIRVALFYDIDYLPQAAFALPIYERASNTYEWKANPYTLDDFAGSPGNVVFSGVDYCLAYWLGRRHGFVWPHE